MKSGKLLRSVLAFAVVIYAAICLFMWVGQRSLMYVPVRGISPPESYGLVAFSDVELSAEDGTKVHLWVHAARNNFPTLLFFHGNGGNLADRANYFRALADAGFGLIALDYRGYGASEGSPSEEGFYQDARATVHYAADVLHLSPRQQLFYGESIGTGVAVEMATEFASAALVLQSPFTSLEAIASKRYFWLPVHFLIIDRFDSLSKITHTHTPLLLLHGEEDHIVPLEEGKALFAKAPEPKESVYFPHQGHNDLSIEARLSALLAFMQKQHLMAQ